MKVIFLTCRVTPPMPEVMQWLQYTRTQQRVSKTARVKNVQHHMPGDT